MRCFSSGVNTVKVSTKMKKKKSIFCSVNDEIFVQKYKLNPASKNGGKTALHGAPTLPSTVVLSFDW